MNVKNTKLTTHSHNLAAMGSVSANVHKESRELNSPPGGGCSRHWKKQKQVS